MLVIELVFKREICWALWSLALRDLLKLSPWSEGLSRQAQVRALMNKPLGGPRATPLGKKFWPIFI